VGGEFVDIGLRQQSSLPHYRSRRKSHLVTVKGTTQEWSLFFLAHPDLAMSLAPGAAAMTSLFVIMTMAVSVVAVSIATTVSSTAIDQVIQGRLTGRPEARAARRVLADRSPSPGKRPAPWEIDEQGELPEFVVKCSPWCGTPSRSETSLDSCSLMMLVWQVCHPSLTDM
jgi:hypothetical protein